MMSKHAIRWINTTRNKHQHLLFIGHPTSPLANNLYEALGRRASLSISLHPDSKLISTCTAYDCYILDADYLGDVTEVMEKILRMQAKARILVISDSYDWEDALNAFRLGAIDVIRTPQSAFLARASINYVLQQQLPQRNLWDAVV